MILHLEGQPGDSIWSVAESLVKIATVFGVQAQTKFNGKDVRARVWPMRDSVDDVVRRYDPRVADMMQGGEE